MSTAPSPVTTAAPATTPAVQTPTPGPISAFLKLHERLIILALVLAVSVHFYGKVAQAYLEHEQTVATVSHDALQATVAQSAANNQSTQDALKQYQLMVSQLSVSNAQLAANQVQRNSQTTTQQAQDNKMPPTALAQRWTSLLNLSADSIAASATGFAVTVPAAQSTVDQLEEVPTLEANLKDEQQTSDNKTQQLAGLATLSGDQQVQIDGLNKQLTAQSTACTADKKVLQTQAKAGFWRGFKYGFVAGAGATAAAVIAFLK